ncbi:hypothetical protein F4778DRAFT_755913 [Xylariomycetidae sp. FL2044]|nr:hypothetical protein F4778DRAFT_755913 [Xylariomycetidae sp. FL2044]
MKCQCPAFVLLAAALGNLGSLVYGHAISRRAIDLPGPDSFGRLAYAAAAVIGDYVYIDGGQISQQIDGTGTALQALNATLSLSLKDSWTNDTVELQSIDKIAPLLSQQIYWTDTTTNNLYTWSGSAAEAGLPAENQLWRFEAAGDGGGQWSQVVQRDYLDFSNLRRSVGSAVTQSDKVGFALGGQVSARTDPLIQKTDPGYAVPGIVSYNFQSGQWSNSSSTDFEGYGTNLYGLAEFIPFGPNGLLLFLGGAETPVDATQDSIIQLSWNTLTLYDPVTQKWYTQETSGMRPPTVERACSVGVQGLNSTYEIFIYGGSSDQIHGTSSSVYVLTIPGFSFFEASTSGTPRSDHACVVVGQGKRQMLSVGGIEGTTTSNSSTPSPDPWKQGLGIFDLTAMEWVSSYDPEMPTYDSPDVVKTWYANGGMDDMRWDGDDVKALFVNSTTPYGSGGSVSNTTITDDANKTSSSPPLAAIVAGTVAGVVAIAIPTAVLLWRRKQFPKRKSTISHHESTARIPEYKPEPWPKDTVQGPSPISWAGTEAMPIELDTARTGELAAEEVLVERAIELPAPLHSARAELPDRG